MKSEHGKRQYYADIDHEKANEEAKQIKDQLIELIVADFRCELIKSDKVDFLKSTDYVDGQTDILGSVQFSIKSLKPDLKNHKDCHVRPLVIYKNL